MPGQLKSRSIFLHLLCGSCHLYFISIRAPKCQNTSANLVMDFFFEQWSFTKQQQSTIKLSRKVAIALSMSKP